MWIEKVVRQLRDTVSGQVDVDWSVLMNSVAFTARKFWFIIEGISMKDHTELLAKFINMVDCVPWLFNTQLWKEARVD